jgi:hypothetical protein
MLGAAGGEDGSTFLVGLKNVLDIHWDRERIIFS